MINYDGGNHTTTLSLHSTNQYPDEHMWLRSDRYHPTPSETIPHLVNKLYFQKNGKFLDSKWRKHLGSPNLTAAHESWTIQNPSYRVRFFDLATARKYLEQYYHKAFLRAFDCIQPFSSKSDLFRSALLYREGGWHSDYKQVCLQLKLLDRISNETDFFVTRDIGGRVAQTNHCLSNALVGSVPRHAVVAKNLELILRNVQSQHYGDSPIHATGPCVLGKAFKEVKGAGAYYELTGRYRNNLFQWNGKDIVQHKCDGCGASQSWTLGNNYNTLWKQKTYYCEDAASIFED